MNQNTRCGRTFGHQRDPGDFHHAGDRVIASSAVENGVLLIGEWRTASKRGVGHPCPILSLAQPASSEATWPIVSSPTATPSSDTTICRPAGCAFSSRPRQPELPVCPGRLCSTRGADRGHEGRDLRLSSRRQRRRALRHGAPGARPSIRTRIATFNVLEAMRANGCKRIGFSSTGSIYGEPEIFPTPEDAPFPLQTSLYGASKLAAEGMIQAYCEGFGFQGYIFRFVSILGERYTHGHVFDFYKKLSDDPTQASCPWQRQAAQVLSLRARLHRRDAARDPRAEQQGPCAQPRHRRSKPRQRLDRLDLGAARRCARS